MKLYAYHFMLINNFSANLKDSKVKFLSEVANIKWGLQLSKSDMENGRNTNSNAYSSV